MKVSFTGIRNYSIIKPSDDETLLFFEVDNNWKKDIDKFTPYLDKSSKPKMKERIALVCENNPNEAHFYLNSYLLKPNDENLSLFETFANIIKKTLKRPIMSNDDIEKEIIFKVHSKELLDLITNSIRKYLE